MLNNDEMRWFYRSAFRMMHNRLKRSIPSLPTCLSYHMFTPPWLRRTLVTSDNSATANLDDLAIPDLRSHSSMYGRRRITLLLAAFYEYEPDMCSGLMDWLYVNRKLLVQRYRAKVLMASGRYHHGNYQQQAHEHQHHERQYSQQQHSHQQQHSQVHDSHQEVQQQQQQEQPQGTQRPKRGTTTAASMTNRKRQRVNVDKLESG